MYLLEMGKENRRYERCKLTYCLPVVILKRFSHKQSGKYVAPSQHEVTGLAILCFDTIV